MGPKSIDSCSVPVPPIKMRQMDKASGRHVSRQKKLTSRYGIADVFGNFFEKMIDPIHVPSKSPTD